MDNPGHSRAIDDNTANFHQNPLIVQEIFKNLSYKDLKSCSQVCSLWKWEASKQLVLPNIFSYLPVKDLKNCRLVSSDWKRRADYFFKSKAQLSFKTTEDIIEYTEVFQENMPRLTNLKFNTNVHLEDLNVISHFTDRIGPSVTRLVLHRAKWSYKSLRELLFDKLPNLTTLEIVLGILPGTRSKRERDRLGPYDRLVIAHVKDPFRPSTSKSLSSSVPPEWPTLPKLRKLTLDINVIDESGAWRPKSREFLSDLLKSVPNLEEFNWFKGAVNPLVLDFILGRQNINLPKLQNLRTSEFYTSSQLEKLEQRQFPLKYFRIRIQQSHFPMIYVHRLIKSLSSSLEFLGLVFVHGNIIKYEDEAKSFPREISQKLTNLKRLELVGLEYTNYDFLIDLKSLQVLFLTRMYLQNFVFEESKIYPHSDLFVSLKEVHLHRCIEQEFNRKAIDVLPQKVKIVATESCQPGEDVHEIRMPNFMFNFEQEQDQ